MYSKVVVPLDGFEISEGCLPYARMVSGALSVPIELMEAFDVLPTALHDHLAKVATDRMLEESRRRSEAYLAGVRERLRTDGFTAAATALPGAPAQAIVDCAGDDPDALVVMSTHGRGGIARWALGSVADKVLHTISNPVLLTRTGSAPAQGDLNAVLAPLDGSSFSELSLEHATAMARALDVGVILLRVTPDAELYRNYLGEQAAGGSDDGWVSAEDLMRADGNAARLSLNDAARRLSGEFGFRGEVSQLTVEGRNVAQAIVDTAASRRALTVMTTHGRGGINRLVLGSVTDRVVRHCDRPVLVIRNREEPSFTAIPQPA